MKRRGCGSARDVPQPVIGCAWLGVEGGWRGWGSGENRRVGTFCDSRLPPRVRVGIMEDSLTDSHSSQVKPKTVYSIDRILGHAVDKDNSRSGM